MLVQLQINQNATQQQIDEARRNQLRMVCYCNIGVGQEWQDTIPEMVPQHPCYQQMKPRHLGLISSLT